MAKAGEEQITGHTLSPTAMNADLVENKQVRLETDSNSPDADSQGQFMRYVYAGNLFVNAVLIEKSYAVVSQPSTPIMHAAEFAALEAQAKSARVGCHAP